MVYSAKVLSLLFCVLSMLGFGVSRLEAQDGLMDFAPADFKIGGVVHGDDAGFQNPAYMAVAQEHFNVITSSVFMPWGRWTGPDEPLDFSDFEAVVDWSVANNKLVHGHCLVYPWANTQSEWWMELPISRVEKLLSHYIETLMHSRAGQVWVWDVVNEVIANDGEPMDANGLRTAVKEYEAMGPNYIEQIFKWASEADPNAKLILNSTGCEWLGPKSDRLFKYVVRLKQRDLPIDGVGFQFHFVDLDSPSPNIASMTANLQRFADAGFEIYITEADVCTMQSLDPNSPMPTPKQLERQAEHFQKTLLMALQQPACKAYMLWDFVDDYSWLHPTGFQISNIPPNSYTYPAPFNGGTTPITEKPAVQAMRKALQEGR